MERKNITYDYAIVGAGIIGLTIAFELIKKNSDLKIAILEKEPEVALHASGRNSGIIHAGFYYSEDSLKAKLTVTGNTLMKEFCSENKIQVLNSEKLVVAQSNNELNTLDELYQRGLNNGVNILKITESEAKEIEPCVKHIRMPYIPSPQRQ